MTKPALTIDEINSYRPLTLGEKVWILGLRGANGSNQIGVYDDALYLITPDGVTAVNANTDPSRLIKGVATLVPGTYYYKQGIHGLHHLDLTQRLDQNKLKIAMATKTDISELTYWALRQDSNVSVKREGDPTIHTDTPENRFWIDIHRGGYSTTSSAGCQTVYPDLWATFKQQTYIQMDKYNQPRIPYVLAVNK